MRLSILSSLEPLVREVTALSLSDTCAVILVDLDDEGTTLHLVTPDGAERHVHVALSHSCISCSMRNALIPLLEQWRDRLDNVLVALPPTIESVDVTPSLASMVEDNPLLIPCAVSSVVTAVNLPSIPDDLLTHVSLYERQMALFEDDDRCAGEVLAMNIGHADITVTLGESELATELVDHLLPRYSVRVPGLANLTAEMVFAGHHNVDDAIARVHPITTEAWGGPTTHGVWTLDLSSVRAFHPERLQRNLPLLSPEGVCVRGCFWLPTRPEAVCTWNSSGTSVTVGTAGQWENGQMTHLVVTGVGDLQQAIEEAFRDSLVDEEPFESVLSWFGVADGLDHWFQE